ncbi:MAG: ion transporter [Marinoscillum sp.]
MPITFAVDNEITMTRSKVRKFVERNAFQHLIVSLIVLNSALIGLETSPSYMDAFGFYIDQIDRIILFVFVAELLLKLYAYGYQFFKSAWNLFDTIVILVSIIPSVGATFTVLRALRILRTLRLLKNIPKLKIIIESLLHAIPSIGWIMVLLVIIFYIFAVIGNNLFSASYPEYFGTLISSLFTLFQIMTLESWASNIARPIISEMPLAAGYFIIFILIATYTTLNIFIAIVVNTMNELHQRSLKEEEKQIKQFVHIEHEQLVGKLNTLQKELKEIKSLIQKNH